MTEYTDKQITDYIHSGATICPECGSKDIKAHGSPDFDDVSCWRYIKCSDCNAKWAEHYHIVCIERDETI